MNEQISVVSEQSYVVLRARIGISLRTDESGDGGATLEQIAAIEQLMFDALSASGLRLDLLQVGPALDRRWATRGIANFVTASLS
jgi:hypothetical protein